MAVAVGAACFPDAGAAADFYFSSAAPHITEQGYSLFQKSGSDWVLNSYQAGSPPVLLSSTAVSPTFPVCDIYQEVQDGIALGWLVLTPAFIAWGILIVRKAFFT